MIRIGTGPCGCRQQEFEGSGCCATRTAAAETSSGFSVGRQADDGCESDGSEYHVRPAVVADGDAAEVREAAEQALSAVAIAVESLGEAAAVAAVRFRLGVKPALRTPGKRGSLAAMSFDTWIAFVAASAALLVVPGPVVMLTIARASESGVRSTLPLVLGTTLGDASAMALSLAGLGAFLTASAEAFALLKLAGAGYLVWLGINAIRRDSQVARKEKETAERGSFGSAFFVTALHPGGFVFFVAFLPLFINPERPVLPQLILLGATFLTLAATNVAAWAFAAGTARDWLQRPGISEALRTTSGGLLIATGTGAAWSAVSNWRARTGQV